ncbi:hypothetical protein PLANPX_3824 [Lacipirellula parvula]|uniref:Uncharacterized protein n=2 Tax=Lacipirellula parvula TaxID=2650471 RepID=A0A5K7XDW9_9BACT|nr:hypothetical protein PLANPX_3824 [Lacipirellula parvula]
MAKYAFNINEFQCVQYFGRVVGETNDTLTVNAYDAISLLMIGFLDETGEAHTIAKESARVFSNRKAAMKAFGETMTAYYRRTGTGPCHPRRAA